MIIKVEGAELRQRDRLGMVRVILLLLAVAAGALWWKRDDAIRVAMERVPATRPYLAGYLTGAATTAGTGQPRAAPAVPVVLASAERKNLPVTIDAVGTVQAVASIAIKPRIDSQIASIEVQEGALVKAGDLLVTLDSRSLRAQLAQADATLIKDRAQLQQVRRDFGRAEELLAKRISTEVQRDTAATQVKISEAQLAADQAQRDNIAALLSYTEMRSPISGRIGSIPLKIGTTVKGGDAQAIMTVNQVDPIYVAFAVPQSLFGDLRTAQAAGRVGVTAKVGTTTVQGALAFVENNVELSTGTVGVKALMPNKDERLWPGAFVAVQATLGTQADAVAIPSAAVQIGQQGAFVFVVRDGRKASLVPVTAERSVGSETVISRGLEAGDQVVVDGQLRLVDGAAVQIQQGQPGRAGEGVATGASVAPPAARRT